NLQGGFKSTMVRVKLVGKIAIQITCTKIKKAVYSRFARDNLRNFERSITLFHKICTGEDSINTNTTSLRIW
ncbi:PIPO, partial [Chilli veinal mottle virus]|uniref:PIPO n=1 Tax=Chilli veinal mottle virus TaxID=52280 RepID=UPI00026512E7